MPFLTQLDGSSLQTAISILTELSELSGQLTQRLDLAAGAEVVSLLSNVPGHITWTSSYFSNYFAIDSIKAPNIRVVVFESQKMFAKIRESLGPMVSGHDSAGFYLLHSNSCDVLFQSDTGRLTSLYLIDKDKRIVYIILPSGLSQSHYVPMRAIRSIIQVLWTANGWFPFHAACVSLQNKGLAIIGDRFAGKTTTLLNLLLTGDFDFVSNDKTAITLINGEPVLYGLPISIGVRLGTVLNLPELKAVLESKAEARLKYLLLNSTNTTAEAKNKGGGLFIAPNEIASFFNSGISPFTRLTHIVLPIFTEHLDDPYLEELDRTKIGEAIRTNRLEQVSKEQPYWSSWLLPAQHDSKTEILAHISSQVRVFKLYQSAKTNDKSRRLLKMLLCGSC